MESNPYEASDCIPTRARTRWGMFTAIGVSCVILFVCVFVFFRTQGCQSFAISGHVTGEDGQAVAGAELFFYTHGETISQTKSQANGEYLVFGIISPSLFSAPLCELEVRHDDFQTFIRPINISVDKSVEIVLKSKLSNR